MIFFNWEWATNKGFIVPDINEIKLTAKKILSDVIITYLRKNKTGYISNGGFSGTYNRKSNSLILQFILSEWEDEYIIEEDQYKAALKKENRQSTINKLLDNDN